MLPIDRDGGAKRSGSGYIFPPLFLDILSSTREPRNIEGRRIKLPLSLSLWTLEGLLVLVHRASIIRSASKLGTRSLGKGSRWR